MNRLPLCVVVLLLFVSAQTHAQLSESILLELQGHVTRGQQKVDRILGQSDVDSNVVKLGVDADGKSFGPTAYHGKVSHSRNAGGVRVELTESSEPGASTISASNPDYSFMVSKQSAGASYYIGGMGAGNTTGVGNQSYVRAGFGVRNETVLDMRTDRASTLRSIEARPWDDGRYIVATFARKFDDYATPMPRWMVFDTQQDWRVVQYAEYFVWGTINVSVTYQSGPENALFPKTLLQTDTGYTDKKWKQTSVELQTPAPSRMTPGDFTLEAFGLERPGVTAFASAVDVKGATTQMITTPGVPAPALVAAESEPSNRRLHWTLALGAAGVALLAAAVLFKRRPA